MLIRSPSGAFSSIEADASFSTGTDSPVRADSSHLRLAAWISRPSAGMKSPASSLTISPGTSWEASITCSTPPRTTRAWGAEMFFSASSAFSALLSCKTPRMAFKTTMTRIRSGSKNSDGSCWTQATINEIAAAASRMRIMTSLNCCKKRVKKPAFFFSCKRFSPYWLRSAPICDASSPRWGSEWSWRTSSSRGLVYSVIFFILSHSVLIVILL